MEQYGGARPSQVTLPPRVIKFNRFARMQRRFHDGRQQGEPVAAGDGVYFLAGVAERRIFNTGTTRMRVPYGRTPPAGVRVVN